MRKIVILAVLALVLVGCGDQQMYEGVQDVYAPQAAEAAQLTVSLPREASVLTMGGGETGDIYFCDGYTLTVQTLAGGDLDRTLRTMTGYGTDALTILETEAGTVSRYECAWTSAGEGGDQVGRLLLLDDGAYHYVVTVMTDASQAGDLRLAWDTVFDSVTLVYTET